MSKVISSSVRTVSIGLNSYWVRKRSLLGNSYANIF